MLSDDCRVALVYRLPRLTGLLQSVPYRSGGILPSEMAMFLALAEYQKVDAIIESGRRNGYSTEVLARWSDDREGWHIPIYSFDTDPLPEVDQRLSSRYESLHLRSGDGSVEIPKLINLYRNPAVLLDGPKGEAALALAERITPWCCFTAVHDVSRRREGSQGLEVNPARKPFEDAGAWFTDGPGHTGRVEYLDLPAWEGEYDSRESMTAAGFTLAFLKGRQGTWTS